MTITRKKFVLLFILYGFAFLFITTTLLGSAGPRGFPKAPDSLLHTGSDSVAAWKETVSIIILPIKVVLIGPLALPQINILKEDPPPPFVGIYFLFYWSIFASVIYYILAKLKQ